MFLFQSIQNNMFLGIITDRKPGNYVKNEWISCPVKRFEPCFGLYWLINRLYLMTNWLIDYLYFFFFFFLCFITLFMTRHKIFVGHFITLTCQLYKILYCEVHMKFTKICEHNQFWASSSRKCSRNSP